MATTRAHTHPVGKLTRTSHDEANPQLNHYEKGDGSVGPTDGIFLWAWPHSWEYLVLVSRFERGTRTMVARALHIAHLFQLDP